MPSAEPPKPASTSFAKASSGSLLRAAIRASSAFSFYAAIGL
jgi:hypothetical protein